MGQAYLEDGQLSQTSEFLKRASERLKFKRGFFKEKNIPTTSSNIIAVPFYGDLRSLFILSSFLLKPYKDLHKDKYVILCSWPGFHEMFSYVDEYWTLNDEGTVKILAMDVDNFCNKGNAFAEIQRGLFDCMNIITINDLSSFYNQGFTKEYRDTFGGVMRFLPDISSPSMLSENFKREIENKPGRKILIYPVTKLWSWKQGRNLSWPVPKDFWKALLERLIKENYTPVVYQNWSTYDMSRDFLDRCAYLAVSDVSEILAAMRYVGLVLDIHSGVSRLALASRTPFLLVDERQRFMHHKEYEIDDLCCETPREYIFSFSGMLMAGGPDEWKDSLFDSVIAKLNHFCVALNIGDLASTRESYEKISYDRVRERKHKRMGLSFINSSKMKV
jgi:hypothetical protein